MMMNILFLKLPVAMTDKRMSSVIWYMLDVHIGIEKSFFIIAIQSCVEQEFLLLIINIEYHSFLCLQYGFFIFKVQGH